MKKVLALILSVLMILSTFPVTVLAEELQAEEPESVEEVLAETPEEGETMPEEEEIAPEEDEITPETEPETLEEDATVYAEAKENLLSADSQTIASGFCGGDTTKEYDSTSGAYKNLWWTLDSEGVLTIGGKGKMKNYSDVCPQWQSYSDKLKGLVIEDGITSIGDCAFSRIEFEGTLNLPDSIEKIGAAAFWNTGFTGELVLPENLKIIDEEAFCNVEFCGDLIIPSGVEKIWFAAFQGGCYENVFIPNTVDGMVAPFTFCYDLKNIEFEDGSFYCFENGAILDAETKSMLFEYLTSGYSVGSKPQDEDWQSQVTVGEYVIPETVTWIRNRAFDSCYLPENFVIPKNVEKIDGGAFENSGATDFYFLGNAPEMTDWSFDEDATLYYVSGKSGWRNVTDYRKKTWDGNTVGKGNFGSTGNNLTWVCDKDGVLTISGSGKMQDDFGSNRPWDAYDFYKVVIEEGVTTIGKNSFWNSHNITELVLPGSLELIDDYAFFLCFNIKDLVIPNRVREIGDYAFYCSENLTNITVGENVENIGKGAFSDVDTPKKFYFKGDAPNCYDASNVDSSFEPEHTTLYYIKGKSGWTTPTWNGYNTAVWDGKMVIASGYCGGDTTEEYDSTSGAYKNLWWTLDSEGVLTIGGKGKMKSYDTVLNKNVQRYVTSAPWGQYLDQLKTLVIGDGITSIGDYAFFNCRGLTGDLVLPNSVASIGVGAFAGCSGFTGELVIPDGVTSIDYAFAGCSGFTGDLVIPDSVTSIGELSFQGCSGFNGNLVIGNSVTSIGNYAFLNCSGFTGDLVIPNSVTSIGEGAFCDCSGFTGDLVIGNSVTNIGEIAFIGCSGLTGDLVIPNSVTSIGEGAFRDCSGFTGDLVIGNSVTSIGDGAFYNAPFDNVYFKGNAPEVTEATDEYASFDSDVTFYYLEGKSGWTTPTWNGYNTAVWDGNPYTTYSENYVLRFDGTQIKTEKAEPFIYWNDDTFYVCVFSDEKLDIVELVSESDDDLIGEPYLVDAGNIAETFDAKYGYVLGIPVSQNKDTVAYKTFYFKISAKANGETYLSDSCMAISDVLLMDPNYVKKCVKDGDKVYISTPAYSDYDVARNGYCNPINIAYGWVIDTTTFRLIAEEELNICLDDGLEVSIPEIAEGQKGINFSYERMSNGRVGFSFFSRATVQSDFEIWWNSGITYGELRQLIYPDSSETDNLRFDILKDGVFFNYISINYSEVDADEILEVVFENNAGQNLGTFEFVAVATVIDSGFCGRDRTAEYDEASDAYKNLWWALDSYGTLTIGGKGLMKNYSSHLSTPWYNYSSSLKKLTIEDGVTSIGEFAFDDCSGLMGGLVLPDTVTSIGNAAFQNCTGFTGKLVIPNSVTNIGDYAFYDCTGFTGDLVIPNSVTNIGDYAFYDCTGFSGDLVIPNSVTSIGDGAFYFAPFDNVYFKGNAPSVASANADSPSFNSDVTLYYIKGKSGWTTPTWNGYETTVWNIAEIGDVNEDGFINVIDANIVRRAAAKLITLNDSQKLTADVNGDGSVDVIDANLIRRYAAKLITEFPKAN